MAIREYRAGQVGGSVSSFQTGAAPSAPRIAGADFGQIQQALARFNQSVAEKNQQEAEQRAKEQAVAAQQEMGASGLAQPDEEWSQRYRDAFENQAKAVYDQKLKTDALSTANRLLRENPNNAEGFRRAFETYQNATVESIEQDDPTYAYSVGDGLAEIGQRFYEQAADGEFKRRQEQNRVDALSQIREQDNALTDTLLNNPTEENFESVKAQAYESIEAMDNAALLSPAELENERSAVNDRYARAYVRGLANKALAEQDYEGLQFITDKLREGRWFDDNVAGERLANSISQDAGAMGRERNAIRQQGVARATEYAEASVDAVLSGNTLNEQEAENFERAINVMELDGDADDVALARELVGSRAVLENVLPEIRNMGPNQLASELDMITSAEGRQSFTSSTISAMETAIRDRQELLAEASANNDYAMYGESEVVNTTFADFVEQGVEATGATLAQNRRVAAANSGQSVQSTKPWTQQQVTQAVDYLSTSMNQGRVQEFREGLNTFLAPYAATGDSYAGLRLLTNQDPEIGGAALVGAALSSVSGRPEAEFVQLATQGAAAGSSTEKLRPADLSDRSMAVLQALSGSNGNTYSSLMKTVISMGSGLQVRDPQTYSNADAQRREIENLLGQVEITELSNGQTLVSEQLGRGTNERAAAVAEINAFLEDDTLSDFVNVDNLRPIPIGDRQYRFMDVANGTLLRPVGSDEAITLTIGAEQFEAAIEADEQQLQQQMDEMKARQENALQLKDAERTAFNLVGRDLGVSDEQTNALFRAVSLSPATSISRLPDGVVPETLPETVGQGRGVRIENTSVYAERAQQALSSVRGRVLSRQEMMDSDSSIGFLSRKSEQRLGTLAFYEEMLGAFGNDTQKALAAVAAGRDEVEFAVEEFGDTWLDEMPDEIQMFVNKGLPDG